MNFNQILKDILTEDLKSHDEHKGKVIDFLDKIREASDVFQSLPIGVQNEIIKTALRKLASNGIIVTKLHNN